MSKGSSISDISEFIGMPSTVPPLRVTIEEAITLSGVGLGNCLTTTVGGLSILCSLVGLTDLNYALPEIDQEFLLTGSSKGVLSSAFFLGTIFSCHLSGFLSDTLGRRYVLVRSLSVNFVLYLSASVLPGFITFVIVRFLSGFVVCGACISSYAYLAEMQPIQHRTVVFMIGSVLAPVSFIFTGVLALLVLPDTWSLPMYSDHRFTPWRLYYFLCGLPSLFTVVLFCLTPESPKFLSATDQVSRMYTSLRVMHRLNHPLTYKNITYPYVQVEDANRVERQVLSWNFLQIVRLIWAQTAPLFRQPFLPSTLKACFFSFTVMSTLGFVFVWLLLISSEVHSGSRNPHGNRTVCEVMKSTDVTDRRDTPLLAYYENILAAVLQTCTVVLATLLLRLKVFSIKLIVSSYLVVCLSTSLAVHWARTPYSVVLLVGSFSVFGASAIIAALSVFTQMFPTRFRCVALCLVLVSSRLGSGVSNVLFSSFIGTHCHTLFGLFSVALLVSIVLFLMIPERILPNK